MSALLPTYCLDANVLIQAWQKYYSPKLCPGYWDVLNELGRQQTIFLPVEVRDEITRTEDDLTEWLKSSDVPIRKTDSNVTRCWSKILGADQIHAELVHERKGRSLADPWVVSHALDAGATVVTKEEKVTAVNAKTVKIPNVCENMGMRCIDDFQFLQELNIVFACALGS